MYPLCNSFDFSFSTDVVPKQEVNIFIFIAFPSNINWFLNKNRTKWKKQMTARFKMSQPTVHLAALSQTTIQNALMSGSAVPFSYFDWHRQSAANLLNCVAWRNHQNCGRSGDTIGSSSSLLAVHSTCQQQQGPSGAINSRSSSSGSESSSRTKEHLLL